MKNTVNKPNVMEQEKSLNNNLITRSIAGGLVGVAIGYLATPENGKRLIENISPEKFKNIGSSLGQAIKEKSQKSVKSIKSSSKKTLDKKEYIPIEGYFNEEDQTSENETKIGSNFLNKSSEEAEGSLNNTQKENLDQRLDRLEDMLSKMVEDEGEESAKEKNQSSG